MNIEEGKESADYSRSLIIKSGNDIAKNTDRKRSKKQSQMLFETRRRTNKLISLLPLSPEMELISKEARDKENQSKSIKSKSNANMCKSLKSQEINFNSPNNKLSGLSLTFQRGISPLRKRRRNLSGITLQGLLFNYKIERFIKNIRAHSGLNDVSRLNSDKLKIINDQGASENEILNEKIYCELQRKKAILSKEKVQAKRKISYWQQTFKILKNKTQNRTHLIGVQMRRACGILEELIPLFKPFSPFRVGWEILTLVLTIWNVYTATIVLSFGVDFQEGYSLFIPIMNSKICVFYFEIFCLLTYFLDIAIKFNTSTYNHGEAVNNRKNIVVAYLKGCFVFDVLGGIIPFGRIGTSEISELKLGFLFFKLFPLLISLNNINDYLLNINRKVDFFYQMAKLILKNFIVLHFFACVWHLQAKQGNIKKNWITAQDLESVAWSEKYIRSFYFVVTTMTTVGYGDIFPSNNYEYIVAMAGMLIGSGMIGYTINSIGEILKKKNKSETKLRNKMQLINNYLKKNKVDESLKVRVQKYLEYVWKAENTTNERTCEEILKELPNTMLEELHTQSRIWALQKVFSGKFSTMTLARLVNYFSQKQYSKEEWIFQEGDADCELLIIASGSVELVLNGGKTFGSKLIKIATKQEGEIIGLSSFLLDTPKRYSAKAASICTVFKLSKSKFVEILRDNEEDYETYCFLRDKILLYNDASIVGRKCNSCGDITHSLLDCPNLSYKPFKEIVIKKYIYPYQQQRSSFQRILFEKGKYSHTLKNTQLVLSSLKDFQNDYFHDLEALTETNSNMVDCLQLPLPCRVESTEESVSEFKEKDELSRERKHSNDELNNLNEIMKNFSSNIPFKATTNEKNNQIAKNIFTKQEDARPEILTPSNNPIVFIPFSQQEASSSHCEELSNFGLTEEIRKITPETLTALNLKNNQGLGSEDHRFLATKIEKRDQSDNSYSREKSIFSNKEEIARVVEAEKEKVEYFEKSKKNVKAVRKRNLNNAHPLFNYEFDIACSFFKYFPYNNMQNILRKMKQTK